MKRYKIEELSPEAIGQETATMLGALWHGLIKAGIEHEIAEKLAVNAAGAASCNADGCCGALARLPLVSQPY